MRTFFTLFFIFTLILADTDAKLEDKESSLRLMVEDAIDKLLQSYADKPAVSPTLVAQDDASIGDKLKDASDDLSEKAGEVKDASKQKLSDAEGSLEKKTQEAGKYLAHKTQQAEDYLKTHKSQAKADLDKINVKEIMTHYYENEKKSSDVGEDKPVDIQPVNIEPVNAAAKPLHSQASMWSAMMVLVCVLAIAGGITYFVQEKDVITYSPDSEMERLFKGSYYQSQDSRAVY